MKKQPATIVALPLLLLTLGFTSQAVAQEESPSAEDSPPESCNDCHERAEHAPPDGIPQERLAGTVHFDFACDDCHETISIDDMDFEAEKPHGESVDLVNCGECHEEPAEEYLRHGRLEIGQDPDLPRCSSCHGTHHILAHDDRESLVHPINLPATCQTCHTDIDLVAKHESLREGPIRLYESSVHGQASVKGLYVAATCNDCHSAPDAEGNRTAHRVLSPRDPESPIYHFNIPDTCGQCHSTITKDYQEGIHGQFVERGQVDSPVCTHCHGEHGIISPSDPNSPVSVGRVAQATCSPCHESQVLNEKYGIPAGRYRSWVDSYHGLKSKAGDVHVANCASCHGAHRILPHTDPSSSIHRDNLQETCGECHPKISVELALTPIHATATGMKTGWPALVRIIYLWLIGLTIGGMLLHTGADFWRQLRNLRQRPFVVRMTLNEVFQHWLLMISFITLVISGFSLRFSEAWWVKILFGWGGGEGFLFRGLVHRIAAVLFIICCVWHAGYLLTSRGRRTLRDMLPTGRDLRQVVGNVLFFLGVREESPRFGRFSYLEKVEYWALVWGAVVMSLTGILLWFDNFFVSQGWLAKGLLDIVLVVHYYEAWLATLAIAIWHGYSTVFSPHVYPTNPAWIGGRMPRDMYKHEHPEGPLLKARVERLVDELESDDATVEDGDPPPLEPLTPRTP